MTGLGQYGSAYDAGHGYGGGDGLMISATTTHRPSANKTKMIVSAVFMGRKNIKKEGHRMIEPMLYEFTA